MKNADALALLKTMSRYSQFETRDLGFFRQNTQGKKTPLLVYEPMKNAIMTKLTVIVVPVNTRTAMGIFTCLIADNRVENSSITCTKLGQM